MNFEISNDTIKLARKCQFNLSCLTNEENPHCTDGLTRCSVEHNICDSIIFVNCNNALSCNYCMQFGKDKIICRCPVRYEIYMRYYK
jgi:hypothetical protein